jgi:hypothetical protein
MKSLKIWQRIAIIFLVMLATNVVSLALLNSDKNEPINFIEKERSGLLYLEPLRQLRQWLPVYRRLAETDPKLVDPAANPPKLLNIERAMSQLDELDRKLEHQLSTTEDFVGLRKDWAALQAAVSKPESLRMAYTKVNTRVRALIAVAGDSSGLILDNVLESYYLINVVVVDLPNLDDLLNNLLDSGNKTRDQFLVMSASLKRGLDDTNSHLDVAIHADQALAPLDMLKREHEAKVLAVLAYLDRAKIEPAEYASMVQAALEENFKLYDAVSPDLERVLEQRSSSLRADKSEVIDLILVLMLAGLVLTVWVARSIIVPINRAIQALEAPGGADVSIVSTDRDEVSQLIKAATVRKPSGVVRDTPSDANEELIRENQDLKSLVAELALDNRALKSKPAGTGSH